MSAQVAGNTGSYTGETVQATDYKNAPVNAIELTFDDSIANYPMDYSFEDDLQPGETIIYRTIVYLPKNPPPFLLRCLFNLITCGLSCCKNLIQACFPSFMDLKRTQLAITSYGRLIFWENAQVGIEEPKWNPLSCWACCLSYWCCTKKTLCTKCCKQPWCAPRKSFAVETKFQYASVKDISVIRHEYDSDAMSVFPRWSWKFLILFGLVTVGFGFFLYGFLTFCNIVTLILIQCRCMRQPFRTNLSVYFKHYPLNGSLDANPSGAFHPRKVNFAAWDNVGEVVAGKWGAAWFYNLKADFGVFLANNPLTTIGEAEKELIAMAIAFLSFLSFLFTVIGWIVNGAIFGNSTYGSNSADYLTYSGLSYATGSGGDLSYCDFLYNKYENNQGSAPDGYKDYCGIIKGLESVPIGTISDLLTMLAGALVVAAGLMSGFEDPLPYMKVVADESLYMYNKEKDGKPFAELADGAFAFDELLKINTILTTLANQAKEPTIVRPCPPEWIANPWELVNQDEFGRHPRHIPSLDGTDADIVKLSLTNLPIDPNERIVNVQRLGNVWNWSDWCMTVISFGCHFFCNYNVKLSETTLLVLTDKRLMEVYTKSKSNFRKKNSDVLGCCSLQEWDQTVTTYFLGDSIPTGYISRSIENEENNPEYLLKAGLQTNFGGFDIEIGCPKPTWKDRLLNPICKAIFCQRASFSENNPVKWEGFVKSLSLTASELTVPAGPSAPAIDEIPLEYRSLGPFTPEYETILAYLESEYVRPICTTLLINCTWFLTCGIRPKLSATKFALTTKRAYFISSKTNKPFKCWENSCNVDMLSKNDYTVGWVDHSEIQMAGIVCGADRTETLFSRMCFGGGLGFSHTVFQFAFDNLKPVWFALDWKRKNLGPLDQDRVKIIRQVLSQINRVKSGKDTAIALPSFMAVNSQPVFATPVSQTMDRGQQKEIEMM